jgi:hypothetical protein
MFHYRNASGSRENRRHRRNVDCSNEIPARSNDVNSVVASVKNYGISQHDVYEAGQFFDSFTLGTQSQHESANLSFGGIASHDLNHCPVCFTAGKRFGIQ